MSSHVPQIDPRLMFDLLEECTHLDVPKIKTIWTAGQAAIKTVEMLGYAYLDGAELWKPPLGKKPDFDRLDAALELIGVLSSCFSRYPTDSHKHRARELFHLVNGYPLTTEIKERAMTPTHWTPRCWQAESAPPEGIPGTPEGAAALVMELAPKYSDDSAEAWDSLQKLGYAWVTVDGWADGKKTNVSRSVMVTLNYDARPPVEA